MISTRTALAVLAAIVAAAPAHADVTISTDATQDMSCSSGVCEPTATDAVLNVNDLESYLASGNVEVTTAGSGVDAENIDIEAALTWSDASALSLVATQVITIDQSVSVTGIGALSITNDGQSQDFSFGSSGNVTFANLSSGLSINGQSYTLVNTIKSLAKALTEKPHGRYALAKSYIAKRDEFYPNDPVSVEFSGIFEGLGNAVSNVRIGNGDQQIDGFFYFLGMGSQVRDFGLLDITVTSSQNAGGLAGENSGLISDCQITGLVSGWGQKYDHQIVGGLVMQNQGTGTIANSWSGTSVVVGTESMAGLDPIAGGLAGTNNGKIENSFATGDVSLHYAKSPSLGGLVGWNNANATISQSFATGNVSGYHAKKRGEGGGLVADNLGTIEESYAMGSVSNFHAGTFSGGLVGETGTNATIDQSYSTGALSHDSGYVGGFIGGYGGGSLSYGYWDTTSSKRGQACGYGGCSGVTGLTTTQFQSGLPSGFDPNVWAEDSSINNGFPYLINNPPPQ